MPDDQFVSSHAFGDPENPWLVLSVCARCTLRAAHNLGVAVVEAIRIGAIPGIVTPDVPEALMRLTSKLGPPN